MFWWPGHRKGVGDVNRYSDPAASDILSDRADTIPFLDHLAKELEQRFSSDQQHDVQGLSLIPAA